MKRKGDHPVKWKLKRTVQCAKCPWRKDVNPQDIPNGYEPEKHHALRKTIAVPGDLSMVGQPLQVMACHETQDAHCIGWLLNQSEQGNNIPLRLSLFHCTNTHRIRLKGPQHETFDDMVATVPKRNEAAA